MAYVTSVEPGGLAAVFQTWLAAEPKTRKVTTPAESLAALLPLLTENGDALEHERLAVLALTRQNCLIDAAVLTRGSGGYTIVDPSQIFRWALTRKRPATSIVLGHNHPSGDSTPSEADIDVTHRIGRAGGVIGITLLDHLVLGSGGQYVSLAERGQCGTSHMKDSPTIFAGERD